MKIDDIKKLTNNELNTKVAKLCGYQDCGYRYQDGEIGEDGVFRTKGNPEFSSVVGSIMTDSRGRIVPDYCNDLNAIHLVEAEFLTHEQTKIYEQWLEKLNGWEGNQSVPIWHSSAHRRAVAFVLTMDGNNE